MKSTIENDEANDVEYLPGMIYCNNCGRIMYENEARFDEIKKQSYCPDCGSYELDYFRGYW